MPVAIRKPWRKNLSNIYLSCSLHHSTFSFHYIIFNVIRRLEACRFPALKASSLVLLIELQHCCLFFYHLMLVMSIKPHYVLFSDREGYSTFFWSLFCHWWFRLCFRLLGLLSNHRSVHIIWLHTPVIINPNRRMKCDRLFQAEPLVEFNVKLGDPKCLTAVWYS